jgi:hypothetical protein
MRFLGEFDPETSVYARYDEVVVRTERGLELGVVLCHSTPQMMSLLSEPTHGRIVRKMTDQDRQEKQRLKALEQAELDTCERFVETRKLQMELVDVEHLFGGERIVFYFLAEKRVDFRELVKDLAREYQTRIEMRQIGVRDDATGVDADGEDPEIDARPDENLRAVWSAEVLSALRAGCLRRTPVGTSLRRHARRHAQGPGPRAGPRDPGAQGVDRV